MIAVVLSHNFTAAMLVYLTNPVEVELFFMLTLPFREINLQGCQLRSAISPQYTTKMVNG